jgi:hypothetical protein
MITSFVLGLLLIAPQQSDPQTLQQMQQIKDNLDSIKKQLAPCTAELRRANASDVRKVPPTAAAVVLLNLTSVISKPSDECLPAEIRVTAIYLDAADNVICSGTVGNIAQVQNLTDVINLDVRPWNFNEFVRWRNEPPPANSGPKRLFCLNSEGNAEVSPAELEHVFATRVRVSVLPAHGGMSSAEFLLNLREITEK